MGYVRNKTKTTRHAKRVKPNKRNNTRKQIFRKSRHVNRGGKAPAKRSRSEVEGYDADKRIREERDNNNRVYNSPATMEEKMISNKENNDNNRHHQEQLEQYRKQDAENAKRELYYKTKGLYREPLYPDMNDIYVNQTEDLENTKRQYEQNDRNDAANPYRPEYFGGKKRRATRRK